ncbi:hypothetical protein C348_06443 [Cryptococcus neoformans Gb118]|nr:hypothetical protein C348_06443 [Cryptococcus neoformans var. grubii Gb118]
MRSCFRLHPRAIPWPAKNAGTAARFQGEGDSNPLSRGRSWGRTRVTERWREGEVPVAVQVPEV